MANRETVGEFLIELGLDADDIDKKIKYYYQECWQQLK